MVKAFVNNNNIHRRKNRRRRRKYSPEWQCTGWPEKGRRSSTAADDPQHSSTTLVFLPPPADGDEFGRTTTNITDSRLLLLTSSTSSLISPPYDDPTTLSLTSESTSLSSSTNTSYCDRFRRRSPPDAITTKSSTPPDAAAESSTSFITAMPVVQKYDRHPISRASLLTSPPASSLSSSPPASSILSSPSATPNDGAFFRTRFVGKQSSDNTIIDRKVGLIAKPSSSFSIKKIRLLESRATRKINFNDNEAAQQANAFTTINTTNEVAAAAYSFYYQQYWRRPKPSRPREGQQPTCLPTTSSITITKNNNNNKKRRKSSIANNHRSTTNMLPTITIFLSVLLFLVNMITTADSILPSPFTPASSQQQSILSNSPSYLYHSDDVVNEFGRRQMLSATWRSSLDYQQTAESETEETARSENIKNKYFERAVIHFRRGKVRQFESFNQILETTTTTLTQTETNFSAGIITDDGEIILASSSSTGGLISSSTHDENDTSLTNGTAAEMDGRGGRRSSCKYHMHDWLEAKLILMSVFGTVVAAFGIFGNLTTALILTRPAMRSPNNLYLTALAVFDTCLLVTAVLIYSVEYIVEFTNNFELYVAWLTYLRFCYAVSHISQTGSVYTTVAVTIERYLAVVHPHRSKILCTKRGASISILGVTCFAILFNCTKFFELEISRKPGCTRFSAYSLTAGPLMESANYQIIYTLWLSNVVMVFLPFFTLLIFNSIIACFIRRSLRRLNWAKRGEKRSELKEKSRDATRVLIIIVLIFLICNFWGFVTTLLERIYGITYLVATMPKFYAFSRESINFLAIINSSINFVIYCIFGKDFRKELIVVYGCRQGFTLILPVGDDKFAPWRSLRRRISSSRKTAIRRKRRLGDRHTMSDQNLALCNNSYAMTTQSAGGGVITTPTGGSGRETTGVIVEGLDGTKTTDHVTSSATSKPPPSTTNVNGQSHQHFHVVGLDERNEAITQHHRRRSGQHHEMTIESGGGGMVAENQRFSKTDGVPRNSKRRTGGDGGQQRRGNGHIIKCTPDGPYPHLNHVEEGGYHGGRNAIMMNGRVGHQSASKDERYGADPGSGMMRMCHDETAAGDDGPDNDRNRLLLRHELQRLPGHPPQLDGGPGSWRVRFSDHQPTKPTSEVGGLRKDSSKQQTCGRTEPLPTSLSLSKAPFNNTINDKNQPTTTNNKQKSNKSSFGKQRKGGPSAKLIVKNRNHSRADLIMNDPKASTTGQKAGGHQDVVEEEPVIVQRRDPTGLSPFIFDDEDYDDEDQTVTSHRQPPFATLRAAAATLTQQNNSPFWLTAAGVANTVTTATTGPPPLLINEISSELEPNGHMAQLAAATRQTLSHTGSTPPPSYSSIMLPGAGFVVSTSDAATSPTRTTAASTVDKSVIDDEESTIFLLPDPSSKPVSNVTSTGNFNVTAPSFPLLDDAAGEGESVSTGSSMMGASPRLRRIPINTTASDAADQRETTASLIGWRDGKKSSLTGSGSGCSDGGGSMIIVGGGDRFVGSDSSASIMQASAVRGGQQQSQNNTAAAVENYYQQQSGRTSRRTSNEHHYYHYFDQQQDDQDAGGVIWL